MTNRERWRLYGYLGSIRMAQLALNRLSTEDAFSPHLRDWATELSINLNNLGLRVTSELRAIDETLKAKRKNDKRN